MSTRKKKKITNDLFSHTHRQTDMHRSTSQQSFYLSFFSSQIKHKKTNKENTQKQQDND